MILTTRNYFFNPLQKGFYPKFQVTLLEHLEQRANLIGNRVTIEMAKRKIKDWIEPKTIGCGEY